MTQSLTTDGTQRGRPRPATRGGRLAGFFVTIVATDAGL
jgi:hypothetical protein